MPKSISRKAWLGRHTPGPKDRHIERAWLDEHWLYGGKVHTETADAILAALSSGSTPATGHTLHLKLFAEFANAVEVAGAWGWVIRTRRQHPLLLDAFLTYDQEAARNFYAAAKRSRGSVIRLLDLPPLEKVVDSLSTLFPTSSAAEREKMLEQIVPQAKFLAGRFFGHDEIVPAIFNRTKHGATLLHDESLGTREFWVVAPHFAVTGASDVRRYLLPKFTVNKEQIAGVRRGVQAAGEMIQIMAGLAKALSEAGLLYSPAAAKKFEPAP